MAREPLIIDKAKIGMRAYTAPPPKCLAAVRSRKNVLGNEHHQVAFDFFWYDFALGWTKRWCMADFFGALQCM